MHRNEILPLFLENMSVLKRLMRPAKQNGSHSGITPAQIGIMLTLWHEGPKSIKELSELLCMSSSAATQLVDGLVRERLLERTEDPLDRRKISVALTARGKKKLAAARKNHLALIAKLFKPLSDTEVRELYRLQQKIISHLA